MKKLNQEDLKSNANRLMKSHGRDKIFATQDGNYFLKQHEAITHNNSIKQQNREWDGEVIPFEEAKGSKEKVSAITPELKKAGQRVLDAGTALKAAKKTLDAAEKKAAKKPEDSESQKALAEAKTAYETAQLEVDNANSALRAFEGK